MESLISAVDCQTSSDLDYRAIMPTQWTNEKRCLYLKSLEASFVSSQLHSSMGQAYPLKNNESYHQIKRSWKNINLFKPGKSYSLLANPWISRHLRRTGKNQVIQSTKSREIKLLDCSSKHLAATQSVLCRQSTNDSNTEMMGQNFDANDQVIESNPRRASSYADDDQVVPFNNCSRPKEMR